VKNDRRAAAVVDPTKNAPLFEVPSSKSSPAVATMGIDIGKNSFHVIGLDARGAIVLRQKWSRGQLEARLANMPPCLMAWRPALARIT
jgi:hypothetical protein